MKIKIKPVTQYVWSSMYILIYILYILIFIFPSIINLNKIIILIILTVKILYKIVAIQ